MRRLVKIIVRRLCAIIVIVFYPRCRWCAEWNPAAVVRFILWQRVLNINGARHVAWPVHFTSMVNGNVVAGRMSSPGFSPGCYISGINGVVVGDNVYIGPGVKIISANHDLNNYAKHVLSDPIRIGNNVWLGANVVVLPGVSIGDNAVVGAGAVVSKSLPENVIAVGNPARVMRKNSR